ncbi:MAG: hypothetical protein RI945_23 [Candidatus Parcubacteria bacterium]|jgi:hypothetical protein
MNCQNLFKSLSGFCQLCERLEVDPVDVINHFSSESNLKVASKATEFIPLMPDESIIYKDGNLITGKEKVVRRKVIAGVTCHFISELCFWVPTDGLLLLVENLGKEGYIEKDVIEQWPRRLSLPYRIYFIKKVTPTRSSKVDKLYKEVMGELELNVFLTFNLKYSRFSKKFPNAIQRKNSDGNFHVALFNGVPETVIEDNCQWDSGWWFAGQLIK